VCTWHIYVGSNNPTAVYPQTDRQSVYVQCTCTARTLTVCPCMLRTCRQTLVHALFCRSNLHSCYIQAYNFIFNFPRGPWPALFLSSESHCHHDKKSDGLLHDGALFYCVLLCHEEMQQNKAPASRRRVNNIVVL
jgi:hypothetical protein